MSRHRASGHNDVNGLRKVLPDYTFPPARRSETERFYSKCRQEAAKNLKCACGNVALYMMRVFPVVKKIEYVGYCKKCKPGGERK